MSPTVSVLVTTFDHAPFVEESLESLRSQTFEDIEVVITDDASTDATADIVDGWLARTGFPATFVRNPRNLGICANRNRALARTSGRYVCSLSGDDAYEPTRIERQVACFEQLGPDVAAVFSDMRMVDADGRDLGRSFLETTLGGAPPPEGPALHQMLLLVDNFLPAPATMVRRACLDSVGPYDESLVIEDHDMWLRLSDRFAFHFLPELLVRYRVLDSSLSRRPDRQAEIRDSGARMRASWIGRAGIDEESLAEKLWMLGRTQLDHHEDRGARRTLTASARAGGSRRRRAIATVARLPGGCSALRAAARKA